VDEKNAEIENEHLTVSANWRKFCSYGHKITTNLCRGNNAHNRL
jgi:hypothetical protein